MLWVRHQTDGRAEDCRERALGTDQRAGQVKAVLRQQLVEVVAGDAPWNFRKARSNRIAVAVCNCAQCSVESCLAPATHRGGAAGTIERQPRAVVKHDLELIDIVNGLAVGG